MVFFLVQEAQVKKDILATVIDICDTERNILV